MILIGVLGAAGAGKSTLADRLVATHGFQSYSFARPLKEMCAKMFGWDLSRLDELGYKEEQDPNLPEGWTRRKVLQHVGTECFRAIDPDYWVKKGKAAIEQIRDQECDGSCVSWCPQQEGYDVVIPDVRFANEIAAIREMGGWIIRIERPEDGVGTTSAAHVSEREWREATPDIVLRPALGVEHVQRHADDVIGWIKSDLLAKRPTLTIESYNRMYREIFSLEAMASVFKQANELSKKVFSEVVVIKPKERRHGPQDRRFDCPPEYYADLTNPLRRHNNGRREGDQE